MNNSNLPASWFRILIGEGLQSLYALSLEGCPGADVFQATIEVWTRDLWQSNKRRWHHDADPGCLREAFATLRQSCNRWPTPAKFWDALPPREKPKGNLIGPSFGREREAEALGHMADWCKSLGYDTAGNPLP